jgi:hypothetical protein
MLKVLAKAGFIVVIAHHRVRGATEHFYCLKGHDGSDLLHRPLLPLERIG